MTIQDYIKKHGLVLWRKYPVAANLNAPWTQTFFIDQKIDGKDVPFPHGEQFEIFSNAEKTRFVSMNITRGLFRIVHCEMVVIISEWQPSQMNFSTQAIP
jgi:hypothetical protein